MKREWSVLCCKAPSHSSCLSSSCCIDQIHHKHSNIPHWQKPTISFPDIRILFPSHWTPFSTVLAFRSHKTLKYYCAVPPPSIRSIPHPGLRGQLWDSSSLGVVRTNVRNRRRGLEPMAAAAAAAAGDGQVLITFDVDGTLLQSIGENANLLHKKAFSYSFQEVFGIDGTIDVIKHHGSTDPIILVKVVEHYGIPTEKATAQLPELKSKMLEYAKNNSTQVGEGLELLPGVASLLKTLSEQKGVVVGLVTGNLEDIAWLKMDSLGIRPFFSTPNFGGFGSDNPERGELVKISATRAKAFFPGDFSHHIHVGDTPNDIRAAEYGGALAIGVCTGVFTRDDLLEASGSGRAVVLDDLEDAAIFLKACGLGS